MRKRVILALLPRAPHPMGMLWEVAQAARKRRSGFTATFRHLGALGLFFLSILDSSPLPTFGGPDILIVILVAARPDTWWEYVVAATAGSVIGAIFTFKLARRAGKKYLDGKFRHRRVGGLLRLFERWETGVLVASTAVPFPLPTSVFFAAAGASNRYDTRKYVTVVAICRAVRYSGVALLTYLYGRHIIRVLRHPTQNWGWLLLIVTIFAGVVAIGFIFNRRLEKHALQQLEPGHPA